MIKNVYKIVYQRAFNIFNEKNEKIQNERSHGNANRGKVIFSDLLFCLFLHFSVKRWKSRNISWKMGKFYEKKL